MLQLLGTVCLMRDVGGSANIRGRACALYLNA